MKLIFSPPSLDDLIRLFKAWRFWTLGALSGGLIGAAVFYIAPPPYRAHAVVLVDFNLEQAWPQETDRQQFYYLERETRKLEEIAYSDAVMQEVVNTNPDVTLQELQDGMLLLSQPAEGGWNFYVDDTDPSRGARIANTWVTAFVNEVNIRSTASSGPDAFIEATVAQTAAVRAARRAPESLYIFVGAVMVLMLGSIVVLFFKKPE